MANTEKPSGSRLSVGEWLSRSFEWRIPVYQRHYAWDSGLDSGPLHLFWETVEEQASARLNREFPSPHYLGAVLVDSKTRADDLGVVKTFDVVDGQQRLTTIQIALFALVQAVNEKSIGEQVKEQLQEQMAEYIFLDRLKKHTKLRHTNFDGKQYEWVLYRTYRVLIDTGRDTAFNENDKKSKIVSTFIFFVNNIQQFILQNESKYKIDDIIDSIKKTILDGFDLVLIVLKETDEAQKVFESLNNYAKPLTTFDLIRNNVFYRAARNNSGEDEKLFYDPLWKQLEDPYWDEPAGQKKQGTINTHIEAYIARMLVAKMVVAELSSDNIDKIKLSDNIKFNRNDIFKTYKKFSTLYGNITDEVESCAEYIDIYKYLSASTERNPVNKNFRVGVFRYDMWKNKDFYPLIFMILKSRIPVEQQQEMMNLLESYVIRRSVCGLSSGHYNKDTVAICKAVMKSPNQDELGKFLTGTSTGTITSRSKDTIRFPQDDEVLATCPHNRFYKSSFPYYVLREIEKWVRRGPMNEVDIRKDLWIDHILPKVWEKKVEWRNSLGGDIDSHEIDSVIDTIGNLTLMNSKRNVSKSNHPWEETRGLLRDSELNINRELAGREKWGLSEIKNRSTELARIICQRWPYPR